MFIQDIIARLSSFWADRGCTILQPLDAKVGAATFHPATSLAAVCKPCPWEVAYVQPSCRPADGRHGIHKSRLSSFHQFQVVLQPTPEHFQDTYLRSLNVLGLSGYDNDIRFVEDDWKSPTLAAFGLGSEVWCNGMEITQFTYFQQMLGVPCRPAMGEIAYGIERLAMQLQDVDDVMSLAWSRNHKYKDLFRREEEKMSDYYFDGGDTDKLCAQLAEANVECRERLEEGMADQAYKVLLKSSHLFNILDARGHFSAESTTREISTIRRNATAIGNQAQKPNDF